MTEADEVAASLLDGYRDWLKQRGYNNNIGAAKLYVNAHVDTGYNMRQEIYRELMRLANQPKESTVTFDPTKPVMLANGCGAHIICACRTSAEFPIVALVTAPGGGEAVMAFKMNGDCAVSHYPRLVNVPPSKWQNIYRDKCGYTAYESKDEAHAATEVGRIAILEIPHQGAPIVHPV